jgi:uncharacterized protein YtpQ (UPF0354 family)
MDDFCGRAMPYLKGDLTGESGPAFILGHEDSPVLRDLGNGLLVAYVVDTGNEFQYIQYRHLSAADIKADEIHAIAVNNLHLKAEQTRLQPHRSIFALFLDGNFEASLMLVDRLWDQTLSEYVQSGFVAAVPARDVLAFTDAASSQGIAALRGTVSRLFPNGDHLISPALYRREGGQWLKFEE